MPTKIAYVDETLNFAHGCSKVTSGCLNCYMFRQWPRLKAMGVPGYGGQPNQVSLYDPSQTLCKIDRWKKPRRIFINSMSDTFHRDVPFEYVLLMLEKALANPRHTLLVLTKRPGRAVAFWRWLQAQGWTEWPDNVWIGVSISTARYLPWLALIAQIPAKVRFCSFEPLLGWMSLLDWLYACGCVYSGCRCKGLTIQWAVFGGESGPGFREMDIDALTNAVDQCQKAGLSVFVKQDSGLRPGRQGRIADGLWALKELPV